MNESDPLIRLLCYEPPGVTLAWTREEWLRHTLLLGSTGCGKTSLLNEVLWQLIHHQAADREQKLGLLILDPKGDDTPAKITAYAEAAGTFKHFF